MIKVLFLILLSSNLAELKAVERVFLDPGIDPLSDEMVNAINSLNTTWKAKRNFVGVSLDYVEGLLGVAPDDFSLREADIQIAEDIPERFDAREAWPYCASISNIPDQGSCGSCWAFGAVGAMSDRICIASGGMDQVELSAQDLLACRTFIGNGCQSGQVNLAWVYWETDGIVTGGAFEGAGCKPYKYAPCNHTTAGLTLPNCSNEIPKRPKCEKKCQPNYPKSYEEDKYYGKTIRSIGGSRRVEKIQTEIMRNGPVEATLILYRDFPSYSSGVYQHHSRERMLEHAVRIIGWGVENGVDYWLVANSWNTYWGDQGYFKIRRGINECGIEDKIYFGTPDFSRP